MIINNSVQQEQVLVEQHCQIQSVKNNSPHGSWNQAVLLSKIERRLNLKM